MYYRVIAKCGHVGRNNYIEKDFYIEAESGKDAAYKVRYMPRVKHDRKDAIIRVDKISKEEFILGIEKYQEDLYFKVTSSTEQRLLSAVDPTDIKREPKNDKVKRTRNVQYILKRLKIMDRHYKEIMMEAING